jgi:hypothetical protein
MPNIRADEYRRRAEDAERKAKECRDPEARRTFDQMARDWIALAEQAEWLGW